MNLSHDLKNIGLYHPARLHPKQNAYLMSFFFPCNSQKSAPLLALFLSFQHWNYSSRTIPLSAHNLGKYWILKEDNRFDEEIQKHKTDK